MKKSVLGILFVGLFLIGAAVFVLQPEGEAPIDGFRQSGVPLASSALTFSEIASVEIASPDSSVEIRRDGEGWILSSHEGYPARGELVENLAERLSNAIILYDRNVEQGNLGRYGLQPVTEISSSARRVTFRARDGSELLTIRVGNVMSVPGGSEWETLIALPDKNLIGVVDAEIAIESAVSAWLRPVSHGMDEADVSELVLRQASGRPTRFEREPEGPWMRRGADDTASPVENPNLVNDLVDSLTAVSFPTVDRADRTMSDEVTTFTARLGDRRGVNLTLKLYASSSETWMEYAKVGADCTDCAAASVADSVREATTDWMFKLPVNRVSQAQWAIQELLAE